MMFLWNKIDSTNHSIAAKYRICLVILSIVFALAGLCVWAVLNAVGLFSTFGWMLCFIGYPIFISWIVVVFWSGRHDFHNGPNIWA